MNHAVEAAAIRRSFSETFMVVTKHLSKQEFRFCWGILVLRSSQHLDRLSIVGFGVVLRLSRRKNVRGIVNVLCGGVRSA